jgi:glycosyltransferase involved in cell wall biosynthesis/SAM-dependent methyltransferase
MTAGASNGVALVIPCFNQARFLGAAIESALAQSLPFHEIVVVDDGSTDDTRDVAARYPVRIVTQANRGLPAARNSGTRETRSQFIVYLDADDRLRSNAVADGLECFARNAASDFVYGHFVNVADDGAVLPTPAFRPCPEDAYAGFLRHNLVGMHAAVMYRRERLLEAGGFDESLPACEDYALYLRMARRGRAASHERVVADYRRHAGSLSSNDRLMLQAVLGVLEQQRSFVRGNREWTAALREGVRNWKDYYGNRLAWQAMAKLREPGGRAQGLGALAEVLRLAPGSLRSAEFNVPRMAVRGSLRFMPGPLRRAVNRRWTSLNYVPAPGKVALGDLDRVTPLSREFGFDRGQAIDRYYIERFLQLHAASVRGRVLEAGDSTYTQRYGGERIDQADVVNVLPDPGTTIVSDLTHGQGIEDAAYDCVILTQTLHLIFDVHSAMATLHRILKPGGTLLLTVPGTISQVASDRWGTTWRWGFTALSLRELLTRTFVGGSFEVTEFGNVLSSIGFLTGLAAQELEPAQLDARDELYPMLICARAIRAT